MRLSVFIRNNRESILTEWEAFARTAPSSAGMDVAALRDHASEMLTVIADDLDTFQSGEQQKEKSLGKAPRAQHAVATAAEQHGAERAESGFTMEEMISEYRALRASVLRLWTVEQGTLKKADIEDLMRFNEAIDQSLAESVTRYTDDLSQAREMFLAILGHDLRTPVGAVATSAQFVLETQNLEDPAKSLVSRILNSSRRMNGLIGDLLDFTRSRLGGGIPVRRARMDVTRTVEEVVDEMAAAHPARTIKVDADGKQGGEWDGERISQALTNLIGNALQHGSDQTEVRIAVAGDDKEVSISIHNEGERISPERLNGIFDPMKRRDWSRPDMTPGTAGNLGLGLYIAERIVNAHNGRIEVKSTEMEGTTFTVRLPRTV